MGLRESVQSQISVTDNVSIEGRWGAERNGPVLQGYASPRGRSPPNPQFCHGEFAQAQTSPGGA